MKSVRVEVDMNTSKKFFKVINSFYRIGLYNIAAALVVWCAIFMIWSIVNFVFTSKITTGVFI